MKSIFEYTLIALAFAYSFGVSISLKPFKIEFTNFYNGLGSTFLVIGVLLILYGNQKKWLKQYDDVIKSLNNQAVENIERSQKILEELKQEKHEKEVKDSLNHLYKK